MKISVITVCYNTASTIEKTILSVLNQTYPDIEYIIIDGGSTDGTIDIIKKYVDKIAYWISEQDDGLYDAMNKGIRIASGDYINFMNAGDIFTSSDVVESIFSNELEDADIIYGNSISQYPDGTEIIESAHATTEWLPVHPIYRHNASFVKSGIQKKYLYDTARKKEFKYALDYLNILTFYENGCSFKKVNKTVVTYEKDGISNNPIQSCILNHRIAFRNKKESIKDRTGFYKRLAKEYLKSIIKKQ